MPDRFCEMAREVGFEEAAALDVSTLRASEMVRNMCAADQCRAYGRNWTCPPLCGTIGDCQKQMSSFRHGILVQTVGIMRKTIDSRAMAETEQLHLQRFHRLADLVRREYPDALCLGAGGCRICGKCAWPDPCRFPERATSSMEGYGLFVTQVCRDNGLAYHHGEKTITYTACILFDKNFGTSLED